jgi:hypothetical protein
MVESAFYPPVGAEGLERDYLVGEIGPSKWIRWGRLMELVESGAIHGYWSAQLVQRVGDAAWHRAAPRRTVRMLVKAARET